MKLRELALAGAAVLAAMAIGANAAPAHHPRHAVPSTWDQDWSGHGDRDWQDKRGGWHQDHDRYWRAQYSDRGFMADDAVFVVLRKHHFREFEGQPFWFHGRYLVRTHDRRGKLIMVEVNPYTGVPLGPIE